MFDIKNIRNDFPMLKNNQNLVYFDNSATTFKPQAVIDAVNKYYCYENANIHRGEYDISNIVSNEYENTRKTVADFINSKDIREIVFTKGDTESLNTVVFGYAKKHLKEGDVILTDYSEHASSILPWFIIAKEIGAKIEFIKLNDDGTFNFENYQKSLNDKVKFVAITHVSNVLGYINPVKEITSLAHQNGSIVILDAAQSIPHIKVDVIDLDVDFLTFSGHKIYGPSGSGILYGKLNLLNDTDPLMYGGGSNARFNKDCFIELKETPYKFESGTPCIEGVIGLNEAIRYIDSIGIDIISKREKELGKYLVNKLKELDNIEIINPNTDTAIVSFNVKGIFSQDVASYLNKLNIAIRTGNHCAKLLKEAIGVDQSIRASLAFYNTKEEIDYFVNVLKDITLEKCVEAVL